MKRVSIDNGMHYVSPAEALETFSLDVMANYMDDGICYAVNDELSPCSDEAFLIRYLELCEDDLIIG